MGGGTPFGSKNKNQFSVLLKSLFQSNEAVWQITPKFSDLKQESFIITVFWRSGIRKQLIWVVLVQSLSCGCIERSAWPGLDQDSLPRWLAFITSKIGAGHCPLASVPLSGGPAQSYSVLMAWQLVSARGSDPRQRPNAFQNLALEVTHCHFCNIILVTEVSPIEWGGGQQGGMQIPRGKNRWKPSWRMIAQLPIQHPANAHFMTVSQTFVWVSYHPLPIATMKGSWPIPSIIGRTN